MSAIPPTFQASKWITVPLLCEADEMRALFEHLHDLVIVEISGLSSEGEEVVSREQFLTDYAAYVQKLKAGLQPDPSEVQAQFTKGLSASLDHFLKVKTDATHQLMRIVKPVIQLQPHWFSYSREEGKFRTTIFNLSSVTWGVQFSYPQLFSRSRDERGCTGVESRSTQYASLQEAATLGAREYKADAVSNRRPKDQRAFSHRQNAFRYQSPSTASCEGDAS